MGREEHQAGFAFASLAKAIPNLVTDAGTVIHGDGASVAAIELKKIAAVDLFVEVNDASDALAFVHQVEGVVDIIETHRVSDKIA